MNKDKFSTLKITGVIHTIVFCFVSTLYPPRHYIPASDQCNLWQSYWMIGAAVWLLSLLEGYLHAEDFILMIFMIYMLVILYNS